MHGKGHITPERPEVTEHTHTCRAGKAASLHSEGVITRPEHKGLEAIGELLHITELLVPALKRKLSILL